MKHSDHFLFRHVKLKKHRRPFSLELRPGAESVVTETAELAQAFIECAIGLQAPLRGKISLGKKMPEANPALRARIGSLFAVEPPIEERAQVDDYLQNVLSLRGGHNASPPDLDDLPLIHTLRKRRAASLSHSERRRLALCLALSHSSPLALFLYDPLQGLDPSEKAFVLTALKQRASSGCIVTCILPTRRKALVFSERPSTLIRPIPKPKRLSHRFILRSQDAEQLAALLSAQDSILSAALDKKHPNQLIVEARNEVEAALAIGEAIVESDSRLFEMIRLPGAERPREGSKA